MLGVAQRPKVQQLHLRLHRWIAQTDGVDENLVETLDHQEE
jgi:hypothetical protein